METQRAGRTDRGHTGRQQREREHGHIGACPGSLNRTRVSNHLRLQSREFRNQSSRDRTDERSNRYLTTTQHTLHSRPRPLDRSLLFVDLVKPLLETSTLVKIDRRLSHTRLRRAGGPGVALTWDLSTQARGCVTGPPNSRNRQTPVDLFAPCTAYGVRQDRDCLEDGQQATGHRYQRIQLCEEDRQMVIGQIGHQRRTRLSIWQRSMRETFL